MATEEGAADFVSFKVEVAGKLGLTQLGHWSRRLDLHYQQLILGSQIMELAVN